MSFFPYPLICHTPTSANKLIFAIIEEYYSLLISLISLILLISLTLPISLILLILIISLFSSVIYFERASAPALCLAEQSSKEV